MTTSFNPYDLLDRVKTASLIDAMGRTYRHKAYVLDLVTPTPGRVLFGPAVTLSLIPYREDLYDESQNFGSLFYQAVGDAPAGKVLVCSAAGYPDASIGGGTKFSRVQNHGMAGILAQGRIRDFHELRNYDFATYCSGEAVHWGGYTVMPYAANLPVEVKGITIVPGDYVFADDSGAAVIPAGVLQAVFEEALGIEAHDAESIIKIRAEDPEDVKREGGVEH